LHDLANNAYLRSDYETAAQLYQESLLLFEELGNQRGIAMAMNNQALVAEIRGDYERARELCMAALQIREKLGDQLGMATSMIMLGRVQRQRGNVEEAKLWWTRSLSILEQISSPEVANVIELLSDVDAVDSYTENTNIPTGSSGTPGACST
jgi:tetratricopeptide (TPR) repeat protein